MQRRVSRWALVSALALIPTAALAATVGPDLSGMCGSICSLLFGCG
ncbi:MAG: hypothetical protein KTR31_20435 [Myxococcales bacterium]|nr:hypothetical protein [Myxococcales bacterium]